MTLKPCGGSINNNGSYHCFVQQICAGQEQCKENVKRLPFLQINNRVRAKRQILSEKLRNTLSRSSIECIYSITLKDGKHCFALLGTYFNRTYFKLWHKIVQFAQHDIGFWKVSKPTAWRVYMLKCYKKHNVFYWINRQFT